MIGCEIEEMLESKLSLCPFQGRTKRNEQMHRDGVDRVPISPVRCELKEIYTLFTPLARSSPYNKLPFILRALSLQFSQK